MLDAEGQLVQGFTGITHKSTADSLAEVQEEDEYGYDKRQQPPSIKKGLNTFTWDLRYPSPAFFKGIILWGASPIHGPLAPPGNYQVRFTAGGKNPTKTFLKKMNSRLEEKSPADGQQQIKLAKMIYNSNDKDNTSLSTKKKIKH